MLYARTDQEQADLTAVSLADTAVSLAANIDDAGFALLPATDLLGGERDIATSNGLVRIEWDGREGDPTSLDHTGLGGVNLMANGSDHFEIALSGDVAQATLTVYSDVDRASRYQFAASDGIVRLPFAAFTAVSDTGADFGNVGALVLELRGDVQSLGVSDLNIASPFAIFKTSELAIDGNGNGRADAGDVLAYTITIRNTDTAASAPVMLVEPLLHSQGQLMTNSVSATRGETAAEESEVRAMIGSLAAGETAVVTYLVERAPTAIVPATVILQDGDTPTGGGGNLVTIVNTPFTDGNGKVGFVGAVDNGGTSDYFVWYDTGITFIASSITTTALTGGEGTMGVGNNGEFIYSPAVNGDDSVWTQNGLLLADNTQAPGFPTGTINTFNSRPTMIPNGTAHWVSGFNETGGTSSEGRMLYSSPGALTSTTSIVLRSDDVIDGLAIDRPSGVGFDYNISGDGSQHIHDLLMDTGGTTDDDAVYLNGSLVARESFPNGSGIDNWDNFDSMSINNAGMYAFSGDTDGATTSDEFIAVNGVIAIREGDTIGGVTLASTASVGAVSINNLGHVAHIWSFSGGEALFFACDATDIALGSTLMLAVGDEVDVDGNGSADATVTDFNATNTAGPGLLLAEDGQIFVEVDLNYGASDLEAVIAVAAPTCAVAAINEIRTDQPSADNDEYFELAGMAGVSLDGLSYIVIGDGTGGSGVIEAVIPLTGTTIPGDGYFLALEDTSIYTPSADLILSGAGNGINFENSDNVTHMLVRDFTGANGDDLDTDDDGILDVTPWSAIDDCVSLLLDPAGGDLIYCSTTVGPDGSFAPGHVYACSNGWQIGQFDPAGGNDTPGAVNNCALVPAVSLVKTVGTDSGVCATTDSIAVGADTAVYYCYEVTNSGELT
ncbi:MAG: hypothetical protein R3E31_24970 [Chloroflexota bacterium]